MKVKEKSKKILQLWWQIPENHTQVRSYKVGNHQKLFYSNIKMERVRTAMNEAHIMAPPRCSRNHADTLQFSTNFGIEFSHTYQREQ